MSRIENIKNNYDGDYYIFKANKELYVKNLTKRNSKTGSKIRKKTYVCEIGKENVLVEGILLALAHNINKLHK